MKESYLVHYMRWDYPTIKPSVNTLLVTGTDAGVINIAQRGMWIRKEHGLYEFNGVPRADNSNTKGKAMEGDCFVPPGQILHITALGAQ